jgi:hypothetical protein
VDQKTDPMRIWIQFQIQGFDGQKRENFFDQEFKLKNAQATGESFSPQKRTSSTSTMKILYFSICVGNFYLPGSGSGSRNST